MASRLAVKDDPRSDERERLARAAERHLQLTKQFKAHGDALAQVHTEINKVQRELSAANRHVDKVKQDASAYRVSVALGNSNTPEPPSIPDARAAAAALDDRLTELRAAELTLQLDEAKIAASIDVSNVNLREAVREVVRTDPAARALVSQLQKSRARFVTLNAAVEYLASNGMCPPTSPSEIEPTWETENQWRLAVAALMSGNADATLPFTNPDDDY